MANCQLRELSRLSNLVDFNLLDIRQQSAMQREEGCMGRRLDSRHAGIRSLAATSRKTSRTALPNFARSAKFHRHIINAESPCLAVWLPFTSKPPKRWLIGPGGEPHWGRSPAGCFALTINI
ncbi:hypothetical protein ACJJTC_018916 [Scirpophaga incertulas]